MAPLRMPLRMPSRVRFLRQFSVSPANLHAEFSHGPDPFDRILILRIAQDLC